MQDHSNLNTSAPQTVPLPRRLGRGLGKLCKQVHKSTEGQVFVETSSRLEGAEASPETLGAPQHDHLAAHA